MSSDIDPSASIARLRNRASQADCLLDPTTYGHVRWLFDACASDPALLAALRARTPEWTGREYLLNVDREGKPALPATPTLVEYRAVYRGRLQPGALSRIRFVDREVAAVALFATSEVGRLIEAAPVRLGEGARRAFLLAYCADFDVDPYI